MHDFIILGGDTDVGKTTFALLWLAAHADKYEYWKPVETGPSDSAAVRRLVPAATVHEPVCRFAEPVAPPLAARRAGQSVPAARDLAARRPATIDPARGLLIETFGGPFSPLNEHELQIELVRALGCPTLLVMSSALGAIGRTVQCLTALETHGIRPFATVLLGPRDEYAVEQIQARYPGMTIACLERPDDWSPAAIRACVDQQIETLHALLPFSPLRGERVGVRGANIPRDDADLLDRDARFVWHPYTPLAGADAPLVCIGAQDEFLHLADGRRIIDGISSWWTILHGHRHPPLMAALAEASCRYDHVHFAGVTHPPGVELADRLLQTLDWNGGRVFYSDNGSTAVEVALKMAYQFWRQRGEPGRTRFVGFEHGYHGDTFGAMAVSRDPVFFAGFEPLLFAADILPLDPERLDAHLAANAPRTAAVIVEPLVQGAGGMRMHTPEELRQLFEVTRKHGVLFIVDEVMTGGGRLGTMWAHTQANITPDLVCAAKTLAGGVLSLAATLAAPHVVQQFDTPDRSRMFFHGHSFTAQPLACAVAVANLKLLASAATFAQALRIEAFWKDALTGVKEQSPVKEVRVRGTIAAIELKSDGGYLATVGPTMRRVCLDHGVLLRPLGSVLYAMPPLCTSNESLAQIAAAMQAAVTAAG